MTGDVRVSELGTPPQWVMDVKTRLEEATSNSQRHFQHTTIFRVHESLRSSDPFAYTPKIVSMGPFHFGRIPPNEYTCYIQEYKRSCVHHLLRFNGRSQAEGDQLLIKSLMAIGEAIPEILAHYSTDHVGVNVPDELAELMLLDACFAIVYLAKGPPIGWNGINMWIWNSVNHDMLLLENQIPIFVIKILMNKLGIPADGEIDFIDFLLHRFSLMGLPKPVNFRFEGEFHHLLHLFYLSLLPPTSEGFSGSLPSNKLFKLFRDFRIPSATELDRSGVKFRKNKHARSFLDITFKCGVLSIPHLMVSDGSNSLFRNLIAFEQCFFKTNEQIGTYIIFMDCLIDTRHDVDLLCKHGILTHSLNANEAVANLFNKLTPEVIYTPDKNYLYYVFIEVNKYLKSTWPKYRAHLMREYFHNPWAIISVIAASILILLTFLETFYTIFGYHNPNETS